MKKAGWLVGTSVALWFCMGALSGAVTAQGVAVPNPVYPPNSIAVGKSLDQWMEAYWRWFLGLPSSSRQVTFLDIGCPTPGVPCPVTVAPGKPFVLPLAGWIGWGPDDVLPDSWWGDPNHIFSITTLDGVPIAEPNAAYYVGPTPFDPPLPPLDNPACSPQGTCFLYQTIGVVIKPLPPGEHHLGLHTAFVDFDATFDNAWNITVLPPGRK